MKGYLSMPILNLERKVRSMHMILKGNMYFVVDY
jgi:hypothetical protein